MRVDVVERRLDVREQRRHVLAGERRIEQHEPRTARRVSSSQTLALCASPWAVTAPPALSAEGSRRESDFVEQFLDRMTIADAVDAPAKRLEFVPRRARRPEGERPWRLVEAGDASAQAAADPTASATDDGRADGRPRPSIARRSRHGGWRGSSRRRGGRVRPAVARSRATVVGVVIAVDFETDVGEPPVLPERVEQHLMPGRARHQDRHVDGQSGLLAGSRRGNTRARSPLPLPPGET